MEVSWQYATAADGRVVAHSATAQAPWPIQTAMIYEQVGALWRNGRWDVTIPHDTVPCFLGDRLLAQLVLGNRFGTVNFTQWQYQVPAPGPSCGYADSATHDQRTGLPTGAIGVALYHAGVLLAVNSYAHTWLPDLPQADAHERALAAPLEPVGTPP
jgi:hypothetical protein